MSPCAFLLAGPAPDPSQSQPGNTLDAVDLLHAGAQQSAHPTPTGKTAAQLSKDAVDRVFGMLPSCTPGRQMPSTAAGEPLVEGLAAEHLLQPPTLPEPPPMDVPRQQQPAATQLQGTPRGEEQLRSGEMQRPAQGQLGESCLSSELCPPKQGHLPTLETCSDGRPGQPNVAQQGYSSLPRSETARWRPNALDGEQLSHPPATVVQQGGASSPGSTPRRAGGLYEALKQQQPAEVQDQVALDEVYWDEQGLQERRQELHRRLKDEEMMERIRRRVAGGQLA